MTKNTIEFSEQPLHDPLTQMFIQDFCNKCSVGADMSRSGAPEKGSSKSWISSNIQSSFAHFATSQAVST